MWHARMTMLFNMEIVARLGIKKFAETRWAVDDKVKNEQRLRASSIDLGPSSEFWDSPYNYELWTHTSVPR